MQGRMPIPDRVLMYASLFAYEPALRHKWITYTINEDKIKQFISSSMLPNDSLIKLQGFLAADDDKQREMLEQKKYLKELLRVLLEIIKNVRGDPETLNFALVLLNGIFEDKRLRIRELVAMQKSVNE